MKLEDLFLIIEDRKRTMPKNSYVATLLQEGKDRVLQKVGEETTEVIIAAKNASKKALVHEIADLLFHLLVLMASFNVSPKDVFQELENRQKN